MKFYLCSKVLIFGGYKSREAALSEAVEEGYEESDFVVIEAATRKEAASKFAAMDDA